MSLNWIVYGPDSPRVSLKTRPDGSIEVLPINPENRVCYFGDKREGELVWIHLLTRKQKAKLRRARISITSDPEFQTDIFLELTAELADLTEAPAERQFFEMYARVCLDFFRFTAESEQEIRESIQLGRTVKRGGEIFR